MILVTGGAGFIGSNLLRNSIIKINGANKTIIITNKIKSLNINKKIYKNYKPQCRSVITLTSTTSPHGQIGKVVSLKRRSSLCSNQSRGTKIYGAVAEWSKATDCKPVQP